MNFLSNIVAAAFIIAASITTTNASETNTISFEEKESSLRGGGNIHRRCRKLAKDGRQLYSCGGSTTYSICSRCPSDENERCSWKKNTHTGEDVFQGCVCKSGYSKVNGYCAGANGKSCIDDVYCKSGYCENDVCVDTPAVTYSVIGERKRCGLVKNSKLLTWNAGTTAACVDLVAADSECSNKFMLKNKNQALGGADNLEYGTECRCVQTSNSCSLTAGGDWNTFELVDSI